MAHVPSGSTCDLEVLTFRQALDAANTPSEEYDIAKWIFRVNQATQSLFSTEFSY